MNMFPGLIHKHLKSGTAQKVLSHRNAGPLPYYMCHPSHKRLLLRPKLKNFHTEALPQYCTYYLYHKTFQKSNRIELGYLYQLLNTSLQDEFIVAA